jgi:hypothetical protein
VPPETFPSALHNCLLVHTFCSLTIIKYVNMNSMTRLSVQVSEFRCSGNVPRYLWYKDIGTHMRMQENQHTANGSINLICFRRYLTNINSRKTYREVMSESRAQITRYRHVRTCQKIMTQFFQSNQICLPTRYSTLVDTCLQLFGCEKAVYFAIFWKYGLLSKITKSNAP